MLHLADWVTGIAPTAINTVDPVPFIPAAGTIVGSLSFLPGGLGGTEATIIWLLESLNMTRTTAATAALLIRLFTLWLAVGVGLAFFAAFRHIFARGTKDKTGLD